MVSGPYPRFSKPLHDLEIVHRLVSGREYGSHILAIKPEEQPLILLVLDPEVEILCLDFLGAAFEIFERDGQAVCR